MPITNFKRRTLDRGTSSYDKTDRRQLDLKVNKKINANISSVIRILINVGILLIASLSVRLSHQQSSISLNTAQWFVSNANGSLVVPAQIPGGIYSDLRRNNVLKQDILYGKNDLAYRWVGHENWTYTTSFTIDHSIATSQSVKLVFHGIDTVAKIFLNGQEVGVTDNMFVRYRFDIKPQLKLAGLQNVLVIKFESPVKYSARKNHQSIRQNRGKIIPPYCPPPAQRGECHVNFIRKMQASFSWDWGPAFPSVGIYRDIAIEFGSFGQIRDILVETRRLTPFIHGSRRPTPAPQVMISSNIRQQVQVPTVNHSVPYLRAPPYYHAINSEHQQILVEQAPPPITIDITQPGDSNQRLLEENWLLKTTLVAEMVQPSFGYNIRVEFNLNGVLHYESEHINVAANSEGFIRLGFNLRIDPSRLRVKPWWPNNAGSQTLYKLTARMMPVPNPPVGVTPPDRIHIHGSRHRPPQSIAIASSLDGAAAAASSTGDLQSRGKPLQTSAIPPIAYLMNQQDSNTFRMQQVSEKEISFGFRTVELIQEPLTRGNIEDGLMFNFRVNGIDLFAMGSNWIPSSVLPEHSNNLDYVRYLLQSAKDANMNMLRVWGGGIYESDEFYKMADEMGIMIWHDFMFACALYPVDDEFLSSTRLEIEQQVQRLQYHPSIVLWAGNNENEMAIAGPWWPEVMVWNKKLREMYSKLYVETLRPIVQILDPTRPYIESSPSNGILSESQPNAISRTPNDNKYGDVHHYDYLSDSFEWSNYPSTRFASEYGFQSYPSFNSLASVTSASDWKYPLTTNVLHRQHRTTGETEIRHQIRTHFNDLTPGGVDKFKSFIYLSQLTQSIAIKTETEFYRRNRFIDPETKLGKTMGALYWQLNDVWPAPTWSSIEFGGKWKMLHYFARRFFFPIQVMPYLIQPPSQTGPPGGLPNPSISTTQQQMQQSSNLSPESAHQAQQPTQSQSPGPLFVLDLVRDDLFYSLDAFNVTVKFYRWTTFVPVWQETIYVRHTRPQNVTRIYEQEVFKIMRSPGVVSLSSGVFQVSIEQQPRLGLSQIDNYLLPVNPSRITAMRVANVNVELIQGPFELIDIQQQQRRRGGIMANESSSSTGSSQWACAYRLTLVTDSIAMFVWLDLNLLNVVSSATPNDHGSSSSSSQQQPQAQHQSGDHLVPPINPSSILRLKPSYSGSHQRPASPPANIKLDALPTEHMRLHLAGSSSINPDSSIGLGSSRGSSSANGAAISVREEDNLAARLSNIGRNIEQNSGSAQTQQLSNGNLDRHSSMDAVSGTSGSVAADGGNLGSSETKFKSTTNVVETAPSKNPAFQSELNPAAVAAVPSESMQVKRSKRQTDIDSTVEKSSIDQSILLQQNLSARRRHGSPLASISSSAAASNSLGNNDNDYPGASFKLLDETTNDMLRFQFSDNAFNMFEPSKVIDLYLDKCLSKSQVEVALEIQTMADML